MVRYFIICMLLMMINIKTLAQKANNDSLTTVSDTLSSPWSFEVESFNYIVPDDGITPLVLGYADYKSWHIEARYNYEYLNTVSLFGGYTFDAGKKLKFSATPMIGFVFGNTNGIAPGLEWTLTWKKLDFYSESEYVFDLETKENDFFYNWTELAITPFNNFRTGISGNRTRLYESDLEIQKGIFAQYSFWKLTTGVHYFNPFSDEYFVIATLSFEF